MFVYTFGLMLGFTLVYSLGLVLVGVVVCIGLVCSVWLCWCCYAGACVIIMLCREK